MFDRKLLRNFDWLLLFTVFAIVAISLITLASTTKSITQNPFIIPSNRRYALQWVLLSCWLF